MTTLRVTIIAATITLLTACASDQTHTAATPKPTVNPVCAQLAPFKAWWGPDGKGWPTRLQNDVNTLNGQNEPSAAQWSQLASEFNVAAKQLAASPAPAELAGARDKAVAALRDVAGGMTVFSQKPYAYLYYRAATGSTFAADVRTNVQAVNRFGFQLGATGGFNGC